jgi:hypothetical protein
MRPFAFVFCCLKYLVYFILAQILQASHLFPDFHFIALKMPQSQFNCLCECLRRSSEQLINDNWLNVDFALLGQVLL